MRLLAQFRDLDRPEHFVWMRGFVDMAARRRGLEAFYGGPVWQRHCSSANATMVDSGNVRLLRPARPAWAPATPLRPRLRRDDEDDASPAIYVLAVALRHERVDPALLRVVDRDVLPAWRDAGAMPLAVFETESALNDYPRAAGAHRRAGARLAGSLAERRRLGAGRTPAGRVAAVARHGAAQAALARDAAADHAAPAADRALVAALTGLHSRSRTMTLSAPHGDVHDFDFLRGRWQVHNRRLTTRLRGADDWKEFAATHWLEQRLGGLVNIDQMDCPSEGFSGVSVRAFDLAERRWAIYWISSTSGVLLPPVFGGFDGDVGTFVGQDVDDGRDVHVRFTWRRIHPDAARWEQAFSLDGHAWETNWVMAFTRNQEADA